MIEIPLFFPNGSYKLFGVLHKPESDDLRGGVVFCHPFAEEKLWTHRVFVSFARELAKIGYAVLRFDYMGHGDSDGEFETSTVESRLLDINCAIDMLQSETKNINTVGLLGLRFGATLAAYAAEHRNDIDMLVLWEPVVDGERYMQEILRSNLTTQLAVYGKVTEKREDLIRKIRSGGTVNIEGYELTNTLFDQSSNINLLRENLYFTNNALIVQCGKKDQPLRKELKSLSEKYTNAELSHVEEEPFWREIKRYYGKADNLFSVTLDWMKKRK